MIEYRNLALAAAFALFAIASTDAARAGGAEEAAESAQPRVERAPVHRTPGTVRRADSFQVEDRFGLDASAGAYLTPPQPYVVDPYVSVEIEPRRWRRRGATAPR